VIDLLNDVVSAGSEDSTAGGDESNVPVVPGNASYAQVVKKPVKLDIQDFHAIHRLPKRDRVIIKFTNRRVAKAVIAKKSELRKREVKGRHGISNPVYLNESMCPSIKNLFYKCKLLKAAGKLVHYAFNNGSLRIRKHEDDHRKHTIFHISDLARATGLTEDDIENIVNPPNEGSRSAQT